MKTRRDLLIAGLYAAPMALFSAQAAIAQTDTTASPEGWSSFITPDILDALRTSNRDVQVIDIREAKYVKDGVIPGAVWIPFAAWRGANGQPGQPIAAQDMSALLGNAGIRLDRPIVIQNHSGQTVQAGRAAIAYWILKSAGAAQIAILNGGFKAWQDAGLAAAPEPSILPPVTLAVSYNRDWWADPLDIFAVTTGQIDGAILDARLDGQVRKSIETGKPLMSMPMAQYIPASFFTNHLTQSNLTAPARAEFRASLEERGIVLGDGILISVCQTGELSALSWFYASEIVGIDNVLYYPDALRGWEGDGGLMFGLHTPL